MPYGLYSEFKSQNASVVSRGTAPVDLNGRGVYYAYLRDADHLMLEVEQLDKPNFEGPIWIAHGALVTPDLDSLATFYQNLLGVSPYRRADDVRGPRLDEVTGLDNVHIRAAWFNVGNMVLKLEDSIFNRDIHRLR